MQLSHALLLQTKDYTFNSNACAAKNQCWQTQPCLATQDCAQFRGGGNDPVADCLQIGLGIAFLTRL